MKNVRLALLILLSLILLPTLSPAASEQTDLPYPTKPDFATNPFFPGQDGGDFGTGLALADINGDGFKDMVVSSGNDKALQHVAVYLNRKNGTFPSDPDWISGDTDHHGTLAVGDIDGDGDNDVAVSVFLGKQLGYEKGGVKVYYNNGGTLNSMPSFTDTGYPSFGCALGDIDGDGDLDLAVACGEPIPEVESFATQECTTQATALRKSKGIKAADNPQPPFKVQNRIYINQGTGYSTKTGAVWLTQDEFVSMAVTFGDVNQDGLMDVLFDSAPLRLYLGRQSALPETTPSWTSEDTNYYGNGIDFAPTIHMGTDDADTVPTITASSNCYMGLGRGGFTLYRFLSPFVIQYKPRTSLPIWTSKYGGWGSAIRLADLNQDGHLDLVTHRWNKPGRNELAGTLLVYLGDGATYPDTWNWSSSDQYTSIIEAIDLADLGKEAMVSGLYEAPVDNANWGEGQTGQSVFYPGPQILNEIIMVEVWTPDTGYWTALEQGKDFTSVPGKGWIALATPLPVGDKIKIRYTASPKLDIVYTNWNCDLGNYIYYFFDKNTIK